ncbi:MAG: HAMP domain-containing protein [Roseiflexaceae bacterium]|nr:HAMP domain-containing protein [Roseiflexaceae bacterium]
MRPPIFWTLLSSFALVILLGICGMLGFFGLAVSGFWQPGPLREAYSSSELFYGEALGDFYLANGGSWQGVEARIAQLPFGGSEFVILDAQGRPVAGDLARGALLPPDRTGQHGGSAGFDRDVPLIAGQRPIGTLVFLPDARGRYDGPPRDTVFAIIRSFVLAGGALAALLLLLAVLLSRWLARPLRSVTDAALQVAGGQLNVRVAGAHIRELDELARAFNTMSHALGDADRQRRQLTADVAHELRTPLSIVKGRLEGIQDGIYQASPEQVARLLDETALLERLIEDLRVLALAEAGQLQLYPEPVDAAELLHNCAASFTAQADAEGVVLSVAAAEHLPALHVDGQRVQQVLANILANALRHTPAGGQVTLNAVERSGPASQWVVITVADTGSGIAPEALPHIFDRFYRADGSRTRSSGGSGLGLAIARQIVLAHGGEISAESTLGRGTTVAITLPV